MCTFRCDNFYCFSRIFCIFYFFFFKQKTAYEMRISDWSSDVCSSDLVSPAGSDTLKGLDNLLHVNGGGTLPENMDAKVEVGALEGSNVDMTQALVDMIQNQRS